MYDRTVDGTTYQLGVLGAVQGALVLYDAQTKSRWSQLFGTAIEGPLEGRRLAKVPSTMTTWGQWRRLHPETTVYVKPEAYWRRYTADHFAHIADGDDGPVRPEDLVVAFEGQAAARAYLLRRLARERLVHDTFEGAPILVYLGPDSSTVRVFRRAVDDRTLHFTATAGEELQDRETGSRWHPVTGVATSGPLAGRRLGEVVSTFSLWYAWHRYRPDTRVHDEP